jgi:hypothetical protein
VRADAACGAATASSAVKPKLKILLRIDDAFRNYLRHLVSAVGSPPVSPLSNSFDAEVRLVEHRSHRRRGMMNEPIFAAS